MAITQMLPLPVKHLLMQGQDLEKRRSPCSDGLHVSALWSNLPHGVMHVPQPRVKLHMRKAWINTGPGVSLPSYLAATLCQLAQVRHATPWPSLRIPRTALLF
ncbi:hypothetical protein VNO77_03648 [Canavalia gladiata]|uniref:Uncharacterized protein n=1 Tax=Canavalia gladiata TaxID=3824 RepID=A0AAN9RCF6_CANGL